MPSDAPPAPSQVPDTRGPYGASGHVVVGGVSGIVADLGGQAVGRTGGQEHTDADDRDAPQHPSPRPPTRQSAHQSVSRRSRPVISGGGSMSSMWSSVGPTSHRAPPCRNG